MTAKLNDLKSITPSGTVRITPTNPPRAPGRYVFQRVKRGLGNVIDHPGRALQLRTHVIPYDPRTLAQRRQRTHMRNAVAAYHAATEQEKHAQHADAITRQVTDFNAYLAHWMRTNPLPTGAAWDAGAANWDAGATMWDL